MGAWSFAMFSPSAVEPLGCRALSSWAGAGAEAWWWGGVGNLPLGEHSSKDGPDVSPEWSSLRSDTWGKQKKQKKQNWVNESDFCSGVFCIRKVLINWLPEYTQSFFSLFRDRAFRYTKDITWKVDWCISIVYLCGFENDFLDKLRILLLYPNHSQHYDDEDGEAWNGNKDVVFVVQVWDRWAWSWHWTQDVNYTHKLCSLFNSSFVCITVHRKRESGHMKTLLHEQKPQHAHNTQMAIRLNRLQVELTCWITSHISVLCVVLKELHEITSKVEIEQHTIMYQVVGWNKRKGCKFGC